jgi:hypothetical protein
MAYGTVPTALFRDFFSFFFFDGLGCETDFNSDGSFLKPPVACTYRYFPSSFSSINTELLMPNGEDFLPSAIENENSFRSSFDINCLSYFLFSYEKCTLLSDLVSGGTVVREHFIHNLVFYPFYRRWQHGPPWSPRDFRFRSGNSPALDR